VTIGEVFDVFEHIFRTPGPTLTVYKHSSKLVLSDTPPHPRAKEPSYEEVVTFMVKSAREARSRLDIGLGEGWRLDDLRLRFLRFTLDCIDTIEAHFNTGHYGVLWGDLPQIGMNKVTFEDFSALDEPSYTMIWDPQTYQQETVWKVTRPGHPDPKQRAQMLKYVKGHGPVRTIPCGDNPVKVGPEEARLMVLDAALDESTRGWKDIDDLDPNDYVEDYTELPWYDKVMDPDDGNWPRVREEIA
jgi:hypothetical protein